MGRARVRVREVLAPVVEAEAAAALEADTMTAEEAHALATKFYVDQSIGGRSV